MGIIYRLFVLMLSFLLCSPLLLSGQVAVHISYEQISNNLRIPSLNRFNQVNMSYENLDNNKSLEHLTFDINSKEKIELVLTPDPNLISLTQIRIANNGKWASELPQVTCYNGVIAGEPNSMAKVVIGEHYFSAIIQTQKETIYIVPDFYEGLKSNNTHIMYSSLDMNDTEYYACSQDYYDVKILPQEDEKSHYSTKSASRLIELAIACDFKLFDNLGGSVGNVIGFLATVYGQVALDFDNEFSQSLELTLSEILISTCASCDPWTSSVDALALLNSFQPWGENGGFVNSYDLAELWTGRDFEGNTVGLSYIDQICKSGKYLVLSHFTENIQLLKIMTSHEMGHSFGAYHNFEGSSSCYPNPNRPNKIMDPVIYANSSGWTDGTEGQCVLNGGSKSKINSALNTSNCLTNTSITPCANVSNLIIQSAMLGNLSFSWTGSSSTYDISISDANSGGVLFQTNTNNTSYNYTGTLENCKNYMISIVGKCGGSTSIPVSTIVSINAIAKVKILDADILDCVQNGYYDLRIILDHNVSGSSYMININLGVLTYSFEPNSSPQEINIYGLPQTGDADAVISASIQSIGGGECDASLAFGIPDASCSLRISEVFDDCNIPESWETQTTITAAYSDPYEWKVAGSERPINNYDDFLNEGSSYTYNNTCLAYFDDNIYYSELYSGTIDMLSAVYDLLEFEDVVLSFKYNFHDAEDITGTVNSSYFKVEVYDGSSWHTVLTDTDSACPYYDVWKPTCFTSISMDVSDYINANFQVRFEYSDGNTWAGMIVLDNFLLTGNRISAGVLPLEFGDLNASISKNNGLVQWISESEVNVETYFVEKSTDGFKFNDIGYVAVNPNSNHYEFIDYDLNKGKSYYRIRAIDYDGTVTFSEIVSIQKSDEANIRIFPNPVTEVLYVEIGNQAKEEIQCSLLDAFGNQIGNLKLDSTSGSQIVMNLAKLPSGLYYMSINGPNTSFTEKFVKQ